MVDINEDDKLKILNLPGTATLLSKREASFNNSVNHKH